MKTPCTVPVSDEEDPYRCTLHNMEMIPGYVARGSIMTPEQMAAQYQRGPLRKHISNRTCHGKDVACLPGLGGKCVACFDED